MMTCTKCGQPTKRNGRRELLHVDYMQHAYDHHAVLPKRVSFIIKDVRYFGTLQQGGTCPNIGCGTAHHHVRSDYGTYHTVSSRKLTYEED